MIKPTGMKYQKIYDMIKERGISTQDLAFRLGINRATVWRKFRGLISFNERERLVINDLLRLNKKEEAIVWNYTNVLDN